MTRSPKLNQGRSAKIPLAVVWKVSEPRAPGMHLEARDFPVGAVPFGPWKHCEMAYFGGERGLVRMKEISNGDTHDFRVLRGCDQ